jgi:hypothetical protein
MVDILPALDILQRSGALEKDIPILIHGYQRKPFQVQSLAALGIPAERILSFEQLGGSHLQAQNLIVPSAGAPVGCLTPRGLEVAGVVAHVDGSSGDLGDKGLCQGDALRAQLLQNVGISGRGRF